MTRLAAFMILITTYAAARAEQGTPSTTVLADMGLAQLQLLSDTDALAIRGRGFEPGSHLVGFEHFQQSKAEFHEHVADFRDRIDGHTFAGAAGFKEAKRDFHKHVKKFHDAVRDFRHKIH